MNIFGKKLYHGTALYPELWSDEVLKQDIRKEWLPMRILKPRIIVNGFEQEVSDIWN